jgi:predicted N-acetyltransferase YhbS
MSTAAETTTGEHGSGAAVTVRPGRSEDAAEAGRICYEAFARLAERHGFEPDFPSVEVATDVASMLLSHPGFHAVVAERAGRIAGSNFLDERSLVAGVGPITVDPETQDRGIGHQLMEAVLERARERSFPGVRLLQAAYHNRSLSLYAKLGFHVREPVLNFHGEPIARPLPGSNVRPATEHDVEACDLICREVHGHDRSGELADAIKDGSAAAVERDGVITGYTTGIGFFHHAVGRTSDDLKALIAASPVYAGPGFLVPARNSQLVRWCLEHGLQVRMVTTLMTIGLYNEPQGAWMPSILY